MTTAASRPISSPVPVSGSSNAKKRSPPISIRSGDPGTGLRAERLEVLQVAGLELLEHRVLDADQRDAAVRRHRPARHRRLAPGRERGDRIAGAQHVRQLADLGLDRRQGRPAPRASRRTSRRPSRGVRTTCAVSPAWSDPAALSSSVASWESTPGACEGVLELAAEGPRRSDHDDGHDEPGRRSRPTDGGRRSGPGGTGAATSGGSPSRIRLTRRCGDRRRRSVTRSGACAPSAGGLDFRRPIGRADELVLSADPAATRVPYAGLVVRQRRPIAVGRAPAPAPPRASGATGRSSRCSSRRRCSRGSCARTSRGDAVAIVLAWRSCRRCSGAARTRWRSSPSRSGRCRSSASRR